jgi:hypothetical protein
LAVFEPLATVGEGGGPPAGGRRPRAPVHPLGNTDRFAPVAAKFVRFTVSATTDAEPCVDELEIYAAGDDSRNVALALAGARATASGTYPGSDIHKLEHLNDGDYGNGRSWISNEKGAGWVQVELPAVTTIDRVAWARDREGVYADRLATSYRIEVATEPGRWTTVATDADRQPYAAGAAPRTPSADPGAPPALVAEVQALAEEKRALEAEVKVLSARPMAYAGTFAQPGPTFRLHRGEPLQPREPVAPGALASVGPRLDLAPDAPEQQRRVKLAAWVTDPSNPLTARVIVNRLWHYHFGQGIVGTPSDFGRMGLPPTHPELLDWLAAELVDHGWRLKHVHRLIVLSATYRQASTSRPEAAGRDAGNALLWRYPPRRLEAEPLRDAILAVSGKLDLRMGGPGYEAFEPNDNYVRVYEPKDEWGPAEWRRMVYQFKPRVHQDGTFGAFDCPDAAQITPRRTTSTTPLQALNLLNSGFMVQQSRALADRVRAEAGDDPAFQAARAFRLAFGRAATEGERAAAARLVRDHGLPALCRALYNANEFLYVF